MSTELKVGDRVEMKAGEDGWMGVPIPDLGPGTVVDTTGEHLMVGWYVEVEWDTPHGYAAKLPSIQSLRKIEDNVCPGCGRSFKGARGLRVHQTQRFQTMVCKPRAAA
jgi:hypothetical protein